MIGRGVVTVVAGVSMVQGPRATGAPTCAVSYTHLDVYKRQEVNILE